MPIIDEAIIVVIDAIRAFVVSLCIRP